MKYLIYTLTVLLVVATIFFVSICAMALVTNTTLTEVWNGFYSQVLGFLNI